MYILDKIIDQIEKHKGTKSSYVLAQAVVSACSERPCPSLLKMAVVLDDDSKDMIIRLLSIVRESDYSNQDQDDACSRIFSLFPELDSEPG